MWLDRWLRIAADLPEYLEARQALEVGCQALPEERGWLVLRSARACW